MSHSGPADLSRFLPPQALWFAQARAEVCAGHKKTHWMWFIFPQLRGLGSSLNARRYGIASLAEARAYLAHPVLGPRLQEVVACVLACGRTPEQIFEHDACKYHACVTLFACVSEAGSVFHEALSRQFAGVGCSMTAMRLEGL